jgi:hypothetical protein
LDSDVKVHLVPLQSAGLSTIHSAELRAAPATELEVEKLCEPSVIVVVNKPVEVEYVTDALTLSPGLTVKPLIRIEGFG